MEAKMVLSNAKKRYYLVDGVLYFDGGDRPDRKRPIVSKYLQKWIVNEYHNAPFASCFTVKKMTQRLNKYFYWAGITKCLYWDHHLESYCQFITC